MTTGYLASASAHSFVPRRLSNTASTVVLLAGYDLMLATLIIVAGSQGVYRFAPPLLLWLAIYAMVFLKLAMNLRGLLPVLRDNFAILAFPLVAFISTTWSLIPSHSAYSATQLLVTYFAGVWVGWRYRPVEIALVIVLALTPLIALSLVNWATGMFGEVYSYAGGLLGIFGNKNTLGRMSVLLGLAALGLLVTRRSRPSQTGLLLCVLAMAALALLLSKSATSTIFMAGACGLFLLLTMHSYRASVQLAIICAGVLAILAGCAAIAFYNIDPAGEVLDLFGKSSNLTGRTFLWGVAYEQATARPWLGVGFDTFWDSNAFLAADRIQGIYGSGLISFHNFILDIWVVTGIPGLIAITVTLGAIAVSLCRYYLVSLSVSAAMTLAIFAAAIGIALFNPLLHGQHGNMIVILVAFAVSARIEVKNSLKTETRVETRDAN